MKKLRIILGLTLAILLLAGPVFAADDLKKVIVIDQIEVLESGHIQIRQATKIMENGKEISKTYHRHVLSPGDSLEGQDEKVQRIAKAVWTPEVVAAYKDTLLRRIP